ncbi:hypothetical protein PIB30_094796 [Stylosanthes scabra]|uniref:Uncharacterized protein n=1 Tax=Stylosanthes scabra TaxID=79078 RepID=A0ABU6RW30_9FABA|nr:hypothetical protein [Stylosanthes scabra]
MKRFAASHHPAHGSTPAATTIFQSLSLPLSHQPPPPPLESASHPHLLVAAPLPISSPSQQRRRSVVCVKSAVTVSKLAAVSTAVSGSLPFRLRWPLSPPSMSS